jgi:hypothetical protein
MDSIFAVSSAKYSIHQCMARGNRSFRVVLHCSSRTYSVKTNFRSSLCRPPLIDNAACILVHCAESCPRLQNECSLRPILGRAQGLGRNHQHSVSNSGDLSYFTQFVSTPTGVRVIQFKSSSSITNIVRALCETCIRKLKIH